MGWRPLTAPRLVPVKYEGPGRLSLMERPQPRVLARTLRKLHRHEVSTVVSALSHREAWHKPAAKTTEGDKRPDLEHIWWPIPAFAQPADADAATLLPMLGRRLLAGEHVVVARGRGVGRSAMIAAALLIEVGLSAEDAEKAVSAAEGSKVLDHGAQRAWVHQRALATAGAR